MYTRNILHHTKPPHKTASTATLVKGDLKKSLINAKKNTLRTYDYTLAAEMPQINTVNRGDYYAINRATPHISEGPKARGPSRA